MRMRKVLLDNVVKIDDEEIKNVINECLGHHSPDFHYLGFEKRLAGRFPMGLYLKNSPIQRDERVKLASTLKRKDICSLYPKEKVTLYPIELLNTEKGYKITDNDIEKHFKDILSLNDDVYKTTNMIVDFGKGAEKFNEENFIKNLQLLLKKSKYLKNIYIL